jgi:hypothetical protein
MVVERRGRAIDDESGQLAREEPEVQRKAAAVNRWHDLAEQLGELPLALQQRHVAKVVALMFDQIEREQYRLVIAASAPQRIELR